MTNDKNEVYIWEQGDNHPRGWLPVDAIKTKQDHHEHYTRTAHIKQVIGEVVELLQTVEDADHEDRPNEAMKAIESIVHAKILEKLKGLKNADQTRK